MYSVSGFNNYSNFLPIEEREGEIVCRLYRFGVVLPERPLAAVEAPSKQFFGLLESLQGRAEGGDVVKDGESVNGQERRAHAGEGDQRQRRVHEESARGLDLNGAGSFTWGACPLIKQKAIIFIKKT